MTNFAQGTLHWAIKEVLTRNRKNGGKGVMHISAITDQIKKQKLYTRKKDGYPPTRKQVSARVSAWRYKRLFKRNNGYIWLNFSSARNPKGKKATTAGGNHERKSNRKRTR